MAEHVLQTPLTESDIRKLHVEDSVVINGVIFGIRDATQIRIFDQGVAPPADLTGSVCLHTAPGVKKGPDGRYEKLSIGTTTSTRMDRFVPGLLKTYGVRAIVVAGASASDGTPLGHLEALSPEVDPFRPEDLALVVLLADTVAGLLERAARIQKLVFVDPLTSAFNRAYFDQEVQAEMARGEGARCVDRQPAYHRHVRPTGALEQLEVPA